MNSDTVRLVIIAAIVLVTIPLLILSCNKANKGKAGPYHISSWLALYIVSLTTLSPVLMMSTPDKFYVPAIAAPIDIILGFYMFSRSKRALVLNRIWMSILFLWNFTALILMTTGMYRVPSAGLWIANLIWLLFLFRSKKVKLIYLDAKMSEQDMKKLGKKSTNIVLAIIIIFVLIMGILTAFAISKHNHLQNLARIKHTDGKIAAIVGGINIYHAKALLENVKPSYPHDIEMMIYSNKNPFNEPFIQKENAVDAWGNDIQLIMDAKTITIISYGADGSPGGEGTKADIKQVVKKF